MDRACQHTAIRTSCVLNHSHVLCWRNAEAGVRRHRSLPYTYRRPPGRITLTMPQCIRITQVTGATLLRKHHFHRHTLCCCTTTGFRNMAQVEVKDMRGLSDLSAVQVDKHSTYIAEDTSFEGFQGEVGAFGRTHPYTLKGPHFSYIHMSHCTVFILLFLCVKDRHCY